MTLRHLEIFCAVCDTLNMTAAAKALYTSQSAVSQAIAELEKHYEVRLFERLSRQLYLTEAGKRLLHHARQLLRMREDIDREMRTLQDGGTLRLGGSVTVGTHLLPPLVARYQQCYPQVNVEVWESNTREIEAQLLKDQLDLALVEGELTSPDLVSHPIWEDELTLICSPRHPFAQRTVIAPEALRKERFLVREEGSGTRNTFETVLAAHGIAWHTGWVCSNADTIRRAVSQNVGVAVLSRLAVQADVAAGLLCAIPIQGLRFPRTFKLTYHNQKYLTRPMQKWIELCLTQPLPFA